MLLDSESVPDFDKALVDGMISDHKKDIAPFVKAVWRIQDPDVKAWPRKAAHFESASLQG